MAKLCTAIILFLSAIYGANAQSITESELIGLWKVANVSSVQATPEEIKLMEELKKVFMSSKFEFKADKRCNFIIDIEDLEIKNGHWKFDRDKSMITIQEWKDKDSKNSILMQIKVVKEGNKLFFLLQESPLKLEMIKSAKQS